MQLCSAIAAKKEEENSIAYDPRLHLDKPNNYDEIKNRARLMYTGIYAPRDPSIEELISSPPDIFTESRPCYWVNFCFA